ncbi:MAG TPA: hypothetical protein VGE89_01215 [Bryobacteraceae bacterium]|jgi:hypothetical protein
MTIVNQGLSPADLVELVVVALLVLGVLIWHPWLAPLARRFETRTGWMMVFFAALPVVLRLALLPHHPAPTPDLYDEFSHLLEADTLRHFRLTNPPHALPQFFETFFVLQRPTYASIYPPGQGLALAIGWTLFGHPWAGVLAATAAFCGLCYWMLRGWVSPRWALAGGLLAVIEFGPLNQWMNEYWGGEAIAAAGCLVFGALPRLRAAPRRRDAILLGLGLAMHLIARPYESIFLFLAAALFWAPWRPAEMKAAARFLPEVAVPLLLALALLAVQNKQVTGSFATMPEALSQYQYGVPAALTFQAKATPHLPLTDQQLMDYKMQRSFLGERTETLGSFLLRLEYRVRYYRFFFLAPLYLALGAFLSALGERRFRWVALTLVLFALGTNFFPAFQLHYVAAVTCLFVLVSVVGLERIARRWPEAARLVALVCAAQFVFWYNLHAFFDTAEWSAAVRRYETWDSINHGNPERRIFVNQQLDGVPGKVLVFVRYSPRHIFQDEWVYNRAAIDDARIVWARDLGDAENRQLLRYYPDRTALVLEPDAQPPSLTAYRAAGTVGGKRHAPAPGEACPFQSDKTTGESKFFTERVPGRAGYFRHFNTSGPTRTL